MSVIEVEGQYPVDLECGVCGELATDYYDTPGGWKRYVCRKHRFKGAAPPQTLAVAFTPVNLDD